MADSTGRRLFRRRPVSGRPEAETPDPDRGIGGVPSEVPVSLSRDKARDAVQQAAGKAEEAVGKRTDDTELAAQRKKDQSMSEDRLETEKAKDATD